MSAWWDGKAREALNFSEEKHIWVLGKKGDEK